MYINLFKKKKNSINCLVASKVFQREFMAKYKLSEIKKVDFLNNQIKFYTQTSKG